jgi:hypothetical protein
VVVSAIGMGGLSFQQLHGDAAEAARVKLFVASKFGFPSTGRKGGNLGPKEAFAGWTQIMESRNMT